MKHEKFTIQTDVISSDDGSETFDIHRRLSSDGKSVILIELYPTVGIDNPISLDVSTMHVINHANELGWSDIHFINLYSKITKRKPLASTLMESEENTSWIVKLFNRKDIRNYEIVIAWGSSLQKHEETIRLKHYLLNFIKTKGLSEQTRHLTTATLSTAECLGTHPLYLGLHHSNEKWNTTPYPVDEVLKELSKKMKPKPKNNKATSKSIPKLDAKTGKSQENIEKKGA